MKNLDGLICIRDGNKLDYCWRESIASMLPVCDRVVVCIGTGGSDNTEAAAREMAEKEPKIAICMYDWPNPKGDINFWTDWMNYARSHCRPGNILQLDADEILHENSYSDILHWKSLEGRFSLWCDRANFFKDTKSLVPHGVCLSHRVVRFLPHDVWIPSDGPDSRGDAAISMALNSGILICHYGFLRNPKQYFMKSRALLGYFFDTYDPRLAEAELLSGNWMEEIQGVEWTKQLIPYTKTHPKIIHEWLKERNHDYNI